MSLLVTLAAMRQKVMIKRIGFSSKTFSAEFCAITTPGITVTRMGITGVITLVAWRTQLNAIQDLGLVVFDLAHRHSGPVFAGSTVRDYLQGGHERDCSTYQGEGGGEKPQAEQAKQLQWRRS